MSEHLKPTLLEENQIISYPTTEELAVLAPMERVAFRFTHAMNQGKFKRFWTWCQKYYGALWIHICTYNLMRLYGLENMGTVDSNRPLLIVANHRSFFDMYVVSAMLFKHTKLIKKLYFPVRGRFFYQSFLGMFVNLVMGLWSMYPPIFNEPKKRLFDQYSGRRLAELCSSGYGSVIGFHPEGTRNKNDDPYSFLPAQPGVGKIIKETQPQVMPVFIAGLRRDKLHLQVLGNWTGGPKIRIHFGPCLDLKEFYAMKNHVRTYKAISDYVMAEVAKLGENDRSLYAPQTAHQPETEMVTK
jgi:1-acyl-sn-glycerol-3-phosphate acyltransferase